MSDFAWRRRGVRANPASLPLSPFGLAALALRALATKAGIDPAAPASRGLGMRIKDLIR